jgi:uncharacterized membrane protein
MPRVNKMSLAVCASLVVLAGGAPAKVAFAAAGLGTIGVAAVSEAFNVRLNRRLEAWDTTALPAEWPQLRSRWASANRVRTLLALAAFGGAVIGGLLV